MSLKIFVVLSIAMIFIDIILVVMTLHEKKSYRKLLASCFFFAAVVTASYLGSVRSHNYLNSSLHSSIYFIGIDFMLFFLSLYIICFITKKYTIGMKIYTVIAVMWLVVDSTVLAINPIKEIAISYTYNEKYMAHWRYNKYLLYYTHLLYSYCLVAIIIILLSYKIIVSPRAYKRRYTVIASGILLVVLMNAVFLFMPDKGLFDFSILFYSIMCAIILWSNNYYSEKGMLNEVRELVLDELGHPIVFFDNEDYFAMCNKTAERFLEGIDRTKPYTIGEFVQKCEFKDLLEDINEDHSFRWENEYEGVKTSYRCDFSVLRDSKKRAIARVFMFTDDSLEYDLLTAFHTESSFRKVFTNFEDASKYPVGVAICDINRLSLINASMGKAAGDKLIKLLAQTIREVTPQETYFARLNDAILMFICFNTDIQKMRGYIKEINEWISTAEEFGMPINIQSSISMAKDSNESIIEAVNLAVKSMKARKMMDASSAHSSLLDSLAQTLQESDSCTREHVKRTQIMGEKLGIRLGLSDSELSNLSLLCMLHDIGKLGVPLEILNKPSKLSNAEWEVMSSHTDKGFRIAKVSNELEEIADLILHHHECWDGSGYPDGLKQESIPMLSRIIAVVDTFDAMTNDRPYRSALTNAQACKELQRCAGTQFDPFIVSEFIGLLKDIGLYDEEAIKDNRDNNEEKIVMPMGLEQDITENEVKRNTYPVKYTKYILDGSGKIISIDDNFETITGYENGDVEKYNLKNIDLIFPEDKADYFSNVNSLRGKNGEAYIEHRLRRKDGSERTVISYGREYFDAVTREPRTQMMCFDIAYSHLINNIISDIKERADKNIRQWEENVRRDSLTGLLNRVAYQSDVQLKLSDNNHKKVMLMSDIDNFKMYNEKVGHKVGDELLLIFANALKGSVGDSGIVCRMGGDEFSALLTLEKDTSKDDIELVIKKIWNNITEDLKIFDAGISISMGAVIIDENVKDFGNSYKEADRVLYKARKNGRNRYEIEEI